MGSFPKKVSHRTNRTTMCKTIVVTSASILSFFCCSTENGKGLWVVYGLGGQYHFQSVVVGYIEYFDDFAIGDCFVGIKSDESLGVVLRASANFCTSWSYVTGCAASFPKAM